MQTFPPSFLHDKYLKELISLLKKKEILLMVGAGSSATVGYPSWKKLIIDIKDYFAPEWQDLSDESKLEYSNKLKEKIINLDHRGNEYYQFLDTTFELKSGEKFTNFHKSLVKLGFCGIITTNYDEVLELAVGAAFSKNDGDYWHCEAIDLCEQKPYRVFKFLRSLSPNNKHEEILHLHGYHKNPENLILTWNDYRKKYGELDLNNDTITKKASRPLDTLHRKVIWSLLTIHSLLFVGFSLEDDFFMDMLEIVQYDFELHSKPIHYAIMSYSSDSDISETREKLKHKGVTPIFYQKVKNIDGSDNHIGLQDLVFEIENMVEETEIIQSKYIKETVEKTELEKPIIVNSYPTLEEMNRRTGG